MTENIREYISVLMDDELPHGKLGLVLDRMEQDPELQRCWVSYQLINDALRSNLPDTVDQDFAGRVLDALDRESRVHVPFMIWRPALRDAAGLAMAASLAAVTIVATQWFGGVDQAGTPTLVSMSTSGASHPALRAQVSARPSPSPSSPATESLASTSEYSAPPTASSPTSQASAADDRLNGYLIDHSAYAAASGVQGMMPYVRVVGYGYNK